MTNGFKNVILVIVFLSLIFAFGIFLFDEKDFSLSERRVLDKFPEVSKETISDGTLKELIFKKPDGKSKNFMDLFEAAGQDQFPMRDSLRALKMFSSLHVFNNLTANKIYTYGGSIIEETPSLKLDAVSYNLDTLNKVYENFIKDKAASVHFVWVPDKNYYFSSLSGRRLYDVDAFLTLVSEKLPFAEQIDITDTLSKDSYYLTDSHWSQDKIIPTANKIAEALGVTLPKEYTEKIISEKFSGVFASRYLLPTTPDKLVYLTNSTINAMSAKSVSDTTGMLVTDYLYNPWKLTSEDMYDFFMSGANPVVYITNPKAENDKELVIFRDSFGSSLSPLLAQGYKKTTVIDLRYCFVSSVGNLANFKNADVLFMYSSTLLDSPAVFLDF